jgi:hypothetical protein
MHLAFQMWTAKCIHEPLQLILASRSAAGFGLRTFSSCPGNCVAITRTMCASMDLRPQCIFNSLHCMLAVVLLQTALKRCVRSLREPTWAALSRTKCSAWSCLERERTAR